MIQYDLILFIIFLIIGLYTIYRIANELIVPFVKHFLDFTGISPITEIIVDRLSRPVICLKNEDILSILATLANLLF